MEKGVSRLARLARSSKQAKPANAVFRLLDANFNRAREGLRVLEDTARFVQNRPQQAKKLRRLRHDLDGVARAHYRELLAARDVDRDSGKKNLSGGYREGVSDLAAANFKRVGEALRVIEEYGKILSPTTAPAAQWIRFEVYAEEKKWSTTRKLKTVKGKQ